MNTDKSLEQIRSRKESLLYRHEGGYDVLDQYTVAETSVGEFRLYVGTIMGEELSLCMKALTGDRLTPPLAIVEIPSQNVMH
ncbi:MAG TPA: hypothetical protein VLF88_00585 [Candidatus Babeliales bacterium]|nr:hypothetical protein [Candidatus Babeliales bacterium]